MKRTICSILLTLGLSNVLFAQQSVTRSVSEFEAIRVAHGIEVVLVEGTAGDVYVSTRNIELDDIYTEVERGMLKIKFRNSSIWNIDDRKGKNSDVRVEVPFDRLVHIEVNTGGILKTQKTIRTEELEFEATTGGEADIDVDVDHLITEVTMGSVVEITGRARSQRAKANMGAVVELNLECEMAYVKANMGAELKVRVTEEIDVSASMGGVVQVYGSPEKRYVSESMGGEVDFNSVY